VSMGNVGTESNGHGEGKEESIIWWEYKFGEYYKESSKICVEL
jgi:hypothetical protein